MNLQSYYERIGDDLIEIHSDTVGNITHTNYFDSDAAKRQFIRFYPFRDKVRVLIPSPLIDTVLSETNKADKVRIVKMANGDMTIIFNDNVANPFAISTTIDQWAVDFIKANTLDIYSLVGLQKTLTVEN